MERWRVPGVAVGLLHGDREIQAGFGVTSAEHPLPVDPQTLFQIASLTKPFTATALLRLVEAGRLDLARPVCELLPDFRLPVAEWTERVRVVDLLTHVGGWDGDRFFVRAPSPPTLEALVAGFSDNRQLFAPGTSWSYNNAGFSVAGRIVERLTGARFEDALRELVLRPLALDDSFFRADEVVTRRVAAPHIAGPQGPVVLRGAGWQPGWELLPSDAPAGGLVSCVRDLLAFARLHLGAGGTLARMRTQTHAAGCEDDAVGIAWLLQDLGGVRFFGHGGQTVGYRSGIWMQAERGFALVVLTNELSGHLVVRDVRDALLREVLGIEVKSPEPLAEPPADLAAYEGDYDGPFWRHRVRRGEGPGELVLEGEAPPPEPGRWTPPPAPPARLRFFAPERVVTVAPDGARGSRSEFGRDAAGRVAWLRTGGRIAPRI
jgi:CubicO group peptidase (beta-lactamase class C family)